MKAPMIKFAKATCEDAQQLTEVQIKTFDDDARKFFDKPIGGPSGYDSVKWQLDMMQSGIYYKILDKDMIIGGMVISRLKPGQYKLRRLYVDPDYQDKGVGTKAISFMENEFPDAQTWNLDTPVVATRNHHFYEKLGYMRTGDDGDGQYLYEKRITQ
jgi:ribosomal protein S18 acetylase RimI-like enzyme